MQEACDKLEAYLGTRQKEIEEFMAKNQTKLQNAWLFSNLRLQCSVLEIFWPGTIFSKT